MPRKPAPPDAKAKRPESIAEAKRLIIETFKAQPFGGWDEREQKTYLSQLGLRNKTVPGLSPDETRLVIEDLERGRLILFDD